MSVLFTLAASAADQVCASPGECANQGVDNFAGTPRRVWASIAALVSLLSVVVGRLARSRANRGVGNGGRRAALVALVAGLIGAVNGAVNLAVADAGPGSGNGVVGGAAALVLGVVGVVLGRLVLVRARRAEPVG
ncbi:DUF6223 family protein [Saccharothrix sp. S26]|uniref:DUF6223 family protein n=1 Tax=Saccharothrix sp. S26 TaxID=2907215 RepID=UPI001F237D94|nr:DUF6223 family protein [Saccharothrix sp. S26]MCE7001127.1 DUF6223 family protein [Saccharothrix sp. S26]